ncbi:MAG: membrane dipeptidase [Rhodospirillaceae bacterium]|nr:membrane dipeptidase [Rhodospirillaceae bacterium]
MLNRSIYAAFLVAGFAASPAMAANDAGLIARARAIQDKVIAIDTHVDIPADFSTDAYDMMKPGPRGQLVHLPTMISGGLDAPFLIVYVGQGERNTAGYARALADAFGKFAAIHKLTEQLYPDKIGLALTAADVRRIHASGRKVALIGVENGYPIGKDLRLLGQFYDYGARYFGLTHNGHNDLGDSAQPDQRRKEPAAEWNGISPLGKQVVARLNALGIMVDVSHSSDKATMDMIAASTAPVIASHSAAKGVNDHARNLSDAALEGIKRTGGVVQIVAFDPYLRPVPAAKTEAIATLNKEIGTDQPGSFQKLAPEQIKAFDARMAEIHGKWPRANVKDLVDHIDYAVKKIGIDYVGISSDFNGGGGIDGWSNAGETFNVTVELVRRGYSEEQIGKIWGGNLLRVMAATERHAADLKSGKK